MNKKRPIHLNPLSIQLPVMAWVSVLHRIAGLILFIAMPALLWTLQVLFASPEALEAWHVKLITPLGKVLTLSVLAAGLFHLIAGVRHLLMDAHCLDSRIGGRITAWLVLGFTVLGVLLAGLCLQGGSV